MQTSKLDRPSGWTGPRPFVGREHLVERLHRRARDAEGGQGRFLFVLGDAGSGKHRLIGRLLEANDARERPMAVVQLRAGASANVWEAARRRVTRRRRIRRFLASTVPEWISAIPVVGNVIAAIIRTVQVVRSRDDPEPDPAEEARRRAGTIAAVDELIEEARGPVILVIRAFEHAGHDDLAGAFHCLRALAGKPVLVVATVTLERGRPPGAVLDLVREAERYDAGEAIEVGALDSDAWKQALTEATGTIPPPDWIRWFDAHQPLTPGRLWALMGEVQDRGGVTRHRSAWIWSDAPLLHDRSPGDGPDVEARLDGLSPDDRRFLALATRDGPTFTAEAVTVRSGATELDVQDRLARLERERWIRFVDSHGTDDDLIDSYEVVVHGLVEALRDWSRTP